MSESNVQKALDWMAAPSQDKIDTHHHVVPDFYAIALETAGGDPSGWTTPQWSASASTDICRRLGVQTAILSLTAPGACIVEGKASYDLARRTNEYCAQLRDASPQQWGFFAALPSVLDTEAALSEIQYTLDVLKADGVTLFTRYGAGNAYLGDAAIEPIWKELDSRRAVVFVHPTHPVDTTKVNEKMPQPVIDYPHETSRAAMDMILQGTRRKYPNCKVILSHAGGSLPYLISRVATPLAKVPNTAAGTPMGLSHEQVLADFRSFHYDLALSASPNVIRMLLDMVPHEHILYGSDFPYAPPPAYPAFLEELENFPLDEELRKMINFGNAAALIPRLNKEQAAL